MRPTEENPAGRDGEETKGEEEEMKQKNNLADGACDKTLQA